MEILRAKAQWQVILLSQGERRVPLGWGMADRRRRAGNGGEGS